ncbi:MAG: Fibronectin type domain protein, partial [Solirubrobacterales bacterium]|nr:Fibronectin type domain protein [Solirubrobacterales bacterium]
SKAIVGITEVGLLGIGVPVHCETSEPVVFNLSDDLTFEEVTEIGPHFAGTVTIPNISCEGLEGLLVAPLLTTLMSGPENPYSLYIGLREPEAPSFVTEEATAVSQVSALLHSRVDPNGEALSSCEFEYGTTTSYGTTVPCEPEPSAIKRPFVGNFVSSQAAGLSEGTTYHYRVLATNPQGTTDGPDQTFTTLGAAGAPEYGRCVAQKGGNYTDEGCSVVAEKKGVPDHKGHFEWVPGPASSACVAQKKGEYTESSCATKSAKSHKGEFERLAGPGFTSATETVKLETPGLGRTVACSASSGKGEVTGLSSGTDRITLTGCEVGGKKCTSEGPNGTPSGRAGVIVTNLLATRLLGSPAEVWTQLVSSEHAPYVAEFGCEGVLLRTSGALAGVQQGDVGVPSVTSTTKFASEAGEQALSTAASEDGGKSWSAADPTRVVAAATNTAASPTEIRP